MESIVKYLDCGKVFNRSSQAAVDFKVTKFVEIRRPPRSVGGGIFIKIKIKINI